MNNNRPLLILHGWGSNKQVMMPLAKELADIRDCYVLDLPGFGNSSIPQEPWNVDDYADLIQQFISDLEFDKVDLLVHSFGGRIALKLCARPDAEQLLDKVLITGGAGMKPKRDLSYYFKKYTAEVLKAPFQILPSKLREPALKKLRQTPVWKALGSSDYSKLSGVMRKTFVQTVTEYLEPYLPEYLTKFFWYGGKMTKQLRSTRPSAWKKESKMLRSWLSITPDITPFWIDRRILHPLPKLFSRDNLFHLRRHDYSEYQTVRYYYIREYAIYQARGYYDIG